MTSDQWWDCYDGGWGDELVPEAFAHPAKVAPALSKRIYDHAMSEGWLKEGDSVVDPFGGIAGFALQAMVHGLAWVGMELEQKFVDLGNGWDCSESHLCSACATIRTTIGANESHADEISEILTTGILPENHEDEETPIPAHPITDDERKEFENELALTQKTLEEYRAKKTPCGEHQTGNLELWRKRYALWPKLGTAVLLQGDSRKLAEVVGQAAGVVSSPPFADRIPQQDHDFKMPHDSTGNINSDYGSTPGNLGNLHSSPEGFDSAIASPPFSDCERGGTGVVKHPIDCKCNYCLKNKGNAGNVQGGRWGLSTLGQLGSMPSGDFSASVSSPPYEGSMNADRNGIDWTKEKLDYPGRVVHAERIAMHNRIANRMHYADREEGQIGASSGDDFWSAARLIVEQTYKVLRPGGHAIWVVKAFVRNKAIVDFPGQWRQLCEACGFVTLHEHHAMLVSQVAQLTLEGTRKYKERKSFFRRLAESKGSPKIDFEVVLCMGKPNG